MKHVFQSHHSGNQDKRNHIDVVPRIAQVLYRSLYNKLPEVQDQEVTSKRKNKDFEDVLLVVNPEIRIAQVEFDLNATIFLSILFEVLKYESGIDQEAEVE